ncbi:ATP-grasp domain-containing protein [Bacteroides sp. ET336]|uniref:ATP-grasp domain-containing protein n=1 Tax=Bacteroides sp. ET336 TaxID=2972459 RepID=UPI0021ABDA00|nr:ATP-grasp domain-containing protein [Bacteroides sp. ET336]MCR8892489.1 ATP-grasp domain-containing protein [Bacteroides sp. ET336]MDN0056985.1 ATP-grasp domain-containing protein [Bacteroides caecigallinarum]
MINILLTSAGRRSYIVDYFKNTNGIGKVHASNSHYSIALERADGYFISPLIYSENYIPSIINYCKENNVNAVLSLFDIDLLVLAKNKTLFENNNIKLILADPKFVEICNDKWETYKFINNLGLNTPKTYLNKEDLKHDIKEGIISYPIIMKPRWGMASMGIYKVDNDLELDVFTEKCYKDIFKSYLKYESSFTRDNAIIYQEIINGEEYGLDVLNNLDGEYIDTFAKQKIAMRSGETDLGRTSSNLLFKDVAKIISSYSKHQGILSVDCFKNDKGIFIIEMNCRISGHYPLAYLAGFNYPQLLIDWLNGKTTDRSLLTFEENIYIVKDLVPTVLHK